MSYYPEPDIRINEKVKVVLKLPNQATNKELDHPTGVHTSNLTPKKDFTALKAKFDKRGINKLVSILTSLNSLKRKVDN